MKKNRNGTLISGFVESVVRYPNNDALFVNEASYSYRQLMGKVLDISNVVQKFKNGNDSLIGVYAGRSVSMFAGILAALYCGAGYVPINPLLPNRRNLQVLISSDVRIIITESSYLDNLIDMLTCVEKKFWIVVADKNKINSKVPESTKVFATCDRNAANDIEPNWDPNVQENSIAYLLFTSGSTGEPKGIAVTHKNVVHFVELMLFRYQLDPSDKFIFLPEFTFDLSIFPLWVAWGIGASVYCVPKKLCMAPAAFISDHSITVWCSVPSTIVFMETLGLLKPGAFPSIRFSVFCGEPLLQSSIEEWKKSAPYSIIDNYYGPTEATVFCACYPWKNDSAEECYNGIAPIGKAFPGHEIALIDNSDKLVKNGEVGEICVCGPQVAEGYWKDPERTGRKFVSLVVDDNNDRRWYKTGDLARKNKYQTLLFVGRKDEQVQISGYRVELAEVENAIRDATGCKMVAALGYRLRPELPKCIIVFIEDQRADVRYTDNICREHLPEYMLPKEYHIIKKMPLNKNGKIDKVALHKMREANVVNEPIS